MPSQIVSVKSNRCASAVDGEIGAIDEAGPIRCQKDNGLSDLVGCGWPARRRLSGQLIECFTHRPRAFSPGRPWAYGINADTAWTVFGHPSLRQQIDGCLA